MSMGGGGGANFDPGLDQGGGGVGVCVSLRPVVGRVG